MFSDGLGASENKILRQVQFIGDEYGGVAGFPSAISLAPSVARDIMKRYKSYESAAYSFNSVLEQLPSRDVIDTLYEPFIKPLHGKSHWQVWATKFWHFVNQDAFPIEDGRVDRFFKINCGNSPDKYLEFVGRFREFALRNSDWIPELRVIDEGHARSDNKLWDKVFYELGK